LRARAREPVAFFGNADGDGFIFVWIESAKHGSGGGEGDFMFAGAAAEQDADAKTLFVWSHEDYFFRKRRVAKEERCERFPEAGAGRFER
jgi:hypothetical protein